ncbi:hypothetical protein ACGFSI_19300 [Streptomyces virginiae]|uniref:hypothetical protein n=1 Tax=Streptomyces virginiae TaxID=1961 RepID=UPI003716310E
MDVSPWLRPDAVPGRLSRAGYVLQAAGAGVGRGPLVCSAYFRGPRTPGLTRPGLPYPATRNLRDSDFEAAFDVVQAADRPQRGAPCTHQGHPFQDNLEGELGNMADVIRDLAYDGR